MSSFGALSHSIAALFYALLSLLLVVSWRGRLMGGLLITACTVSAAWSVLLAVQAATGSLPAVAIFVAELARTAAWLSFLVALTSTLGLPPVARRAAHGVWIATLLAGLGIYLTGGETEAYLSLGSVMIPGGLLMALVGLVLIEQLYRNSPADARTDIKYLALGLGGLFAYDLFLYSEAALFDSLDIISWNARGIISALVVPLIAVAAQRNPRWDLDVFISRQVVFFSTTLVAVGAYLLLMSLGGYYILLWGGSWSGLLQILFFFGALLVLAVLLFSNALRDRVRVFLVKHFFRNKYDYREEWLRLIATLSTGDAQHSGQTLIRAMAQLVRSPGGLLWRRQQDGDKYLAIAALNTSDGPQELPISDSLIDFMRKDYWLVDLREYRAHPDRYGELTLPDWLKAVDRAWLVVPLTFGNAMTGLLLLLEPETVPELNYEDRDLLKTVGRHLAVHLAQEDADRRLAEAQQFEAYNRLTAYLMHDLKNLMAQQTLIVKNAEKHKHNPEFIDDAMATIANSVERMNKVMEQLKRGRKLGAAKRTPVKYVVSNAIDRCAGELPAPVVDFADDDVAVRVDPERFSMVVQHLIRNAQHATPRDGSVTVSVGRENGLATVRVRDTGSGMTPEFMRDRLFKPFDSTKGSQGMGIGAHQVREFAREMGGDLNVTSAPGEGTTVEVRLPVAEPEEHR